MQYLYGSGEARRSAIRRIWACSTDLSSRADARERPVDSSCSPRRDAGRAEASCRAGRSRFAVVLDVDETALLNLGYEYDDSQRIRGL
jgi:hypothetical protein